MLGKYLKSYFSFQISRILAGRSYRDWEKERYTLHQQKLTNKALANELETACQERGFLTFSEYIQIDQYGVNGRQCRHGHGRTDVHIRWGRALARLCQDYKIETLVEFGPGDGSLALLVVKTARQMGLSLIWHGVEINPMLVKKITRRFKQAGLSSSLGSLRSAYSIDQFLKPAVVVFAYSLDSMLPELFINTGNDYDIPNAFIGLRVKEGILEEVVVTEAMVDKRKISLKDGIFTDSTGQKFDLRSFRLHPWQRFLVPLEAFKLLTQVLTSLKKNSLVLIIDEYDFPPSQKDTQHLSLPRDLDRYNKVVDFSSLYRNTGNGLLYFPTYLPTVKGVLKKVGFDILKEDIEDKLACEIEGKVWKVKHKQPKVYYRWAMLVKRMSSAKSPVIPIEMPKSA